MKDKIGYGYIFLAGVFWSTIGFIVSKISDYNFSSDEIAFFRMAIGFIIISIYGKIFVPTMFKITKKGILYVIGVGVISQWIFNISYLGSITTIGASMAAVLLYTSPIFVAIFSRIFYNEKINKIKLLSLVFCVIGAFLAVTGGVISFENLNGIGIFLGVMAGITYAMLPILSKNALKEMDNITMTAYSFIIAAFLMCLRINPIETISKIDTIPVFIYIVAIGLIPSTLAYIVYLKGISTGVELSIAGVVASVELVFAVLIGWTLLKEDFSLVKLLGVFFMVVSTFIAVKAIDTNEEIEPEDCSLVEEI